MLTKQITDNKYFRIEIGVDEITGKPLEYLGGSLNDTETGWGFRDFEGDEAGLVIGRLFFQTDKVFYSFKEKCVENGIDQDFIRKVLLDDLFNTQYVVMGDNRFVDEILVEIIDDFIERMRIDYDQFYEQFEKQSFIKEVLYEEIMLQILEFDEKMKELNLTDIPVEGEFDKLRSFLLNMNDEFMEEFLNGVNKDYMDFILDWCYDNGIELIPDEYEELEEQQLSDVEVEKGGLHKQLGYSQKTNLSDVQTDEIIKRQKQYQNKKKGNYKDIMGKLVWQRNITKDEKWKSKLTTVINELKKWWESKNK